MMLRSEVMGVASKVMPKGRIQETDLYITQFYAINKIREGGAASVINGSTADTIVYILAQDDALTAREIYHRTKKLGSSISYKGLYSALQELVGRGIIRKEERQYLLDIMWIRNLKRFIIQTEKTRLQKVPVDLLMACDLNGGAYSKTFDNLRAVDESITDVVVKNIDKIFCANVKHLWWILFHSGKLIDENLFSAVHKKTFTICQSNTPVDQWCASIRTELNMPTLCGVKCGDDANVYACGDYVIMFTYPLAILNQVGKHFASHGELIGPDQRCKLATFLSKILQAKYDITISVVKNHAVAESVRENVLRYF